MNDIIKLTYQREGEEIKTMKFVEKKERKLTTFVWDRGHKWKSVEYIDEMICGKYILQNIPEFQYRIVVRKEGGMYEDVEIVTESLNPLYLEFITLKDCPECGGRGEYLEQESWDVTNKELVKCLNCTDGKVETLTLKVLFKPKEYDAKIRQQGYGSRLTELKENNASK